MLGLLLSILTNPFAAVIPLGGLMIWVAHMALFAPRRKYVVPLMGKAKI